MRASDGNSDKDRREFPPLVVVKTRMPMQREGIVRRNELVQRLADVAVGPQNPEAIRKTGVPVLDAARHLPGQENMDEWIGANATPSDLIVVPTSGAYVTILEGALNDGIHSLVAITANQGAAYYSSQGALGVTTAR